MFIRFRLGERINNITCLVNSYLSSDCITKLTTNNRNIRTAITAYLFPFNFTGNRVFSFTIWGTILIAALVMTVRFCFLSYS